MARLGWALAAAALALCGVVLLVFFNCNPRDWVSVRFVNAPAGTSLVCVVADVDGRLTPLNWYAAHFGVFTMPALEGQYFAGRIPDHPVPVEWRFGSRYGVLTRRAGGWEMRWYDAKDVPLAGRSMFTGRGEATFDLSAQQPEPLTDEGADRLGLRHSK